MPCVGFSVLSGVSEGERCVERAAEAARALEEEAGKKSTGSYLRQPQQQTGTGSYAVMTVLCLCLSVCVFIMHAFPRSGRGGHRGGPA